MTPRDADPSLSVQLYVRSELPKPATEQVSALTERLAVLRDEGHLSSLERTEWVKRTPLDDCDPAIRDAHNAFTAWARSEGVRLTPFFQTRACFSPDHGEMRDWLVVPAYCLAVSDDDGLRAVYPHADGEDTYTVTDGIDELRRLVRPESDETTVTAD